MNIRVLEDNTGMAPRSERYTAIDDDTYDGVLDGNTTHGTGATPAEAVRDLIEQLADWGEITADEARDMVFLCRDMWPWMSRRGV